MNRLSAKLIRAALRQSSFLEPALACLLTPERLVALTRDHFTREACALVEQAGAGLFEMEALLLADAQAGRALCLGAGGGREAFALARRGFDVVGVEQVSELVDAARERAQRDGLRVRFIRSDMRGLCLEGTFDLILLSNIAYSYVPSRAARVALLAKCRGLLARSGRCVISFAEGKPSAGERRCLPVSRSVGRWIGNPDYELGDRVVQAGSFVHFFACAEDVGAEARAAGFPRVDYFTPEDRGSFAVARP